MASRCYSTYRKQSGLRDNHASEKLIPSGEFKMKKNPFGSSNPAIIIKFPAKRFFCIFFTVVLMLFFTNCMRITGTHDDETAYNSVMFYLLHSGNRNIDICVVFSISTEGVLTYIMFNNTVYKFEYGADDSRKLFKKIDKSFYQIYADREFRLLAEPFPPHFIITYDVNIGNVFFKENQVTPGIYKFIKEFIFVREDWENHHWYPLDDAYIYAIFEVKQR